MPRAQAGKSTVPRSSPYDTGSQRFAQCENAQYNNTIAADSVAGAATKATLTGVTEYRMQRKGATRQEKLANTTNQNWVPVQRRYLEWHANNFPTDKTMHVNEHTLLSFLEDCVLNRRVGKRRKGDAQAPPLASYKTVASEVSAIVDLWKFQHNTAGNRFPHPMQTGNSVCQALKSLRMMKEEQRSKQSDKAAETATKRYSLESLKSMGLNSFTLGGVSENKLARNLRDRVFFLLCHFLPYSGEDTRALELADLSYMNLEPAEEYEEYDDAVPAMMALANNGRDNRAGRREQSGAARNEDVTVCPVSAVALLLFWRYHVEKEGFPDFHKAENWYKIKLCNFHSDNTQPATCTRHRAGTARILGCSFTKTNTKSTAANNRGPGTEYLSTVGSPATAATVQHEGAWERGATNGRYESPLSFSAIKALAGFHDRAYHVPRATVKPPIDLLAQVFPEAPKCYDQVSQRLAANGSSLKTGPDRDKEDVTAAKFLEMLLQFREVVLQDCAVLRDKVPKLALWKQPVFQSKSFDEFALEVLQAENTSLSPSPSSPPSPQPSLDKLQPEVSAGSAVGIGSAVGQMASGVGEVENCLRQLEGATTYGQDEVQNLLVQSVSRLESKVDRMQSSIDQMLQIMMATSKHFIEASKQKDEQMADATTQTLLTQAAKVDSTLPDPSSGALGQTNGTARKRASNSRSTNSSSGSNNVAEFVMNRSLTTVSHAYYEWKVGLNGLPSVEACEKEHGAAWRNQNSGNSKWFKRRKVLIHEIEWLVETKGVPLATALEQADKVRRDTLAVGHQQGTLHRLQFIIKAEAERGVHYLQDIADKFGNAS